MCTQSAFVVPDKLFRSQPAHALHETAFNLAEIDDAIERSPGIMKNISAFHHIFAGERINGNFRASRAIGVIVKSVAFTFGAIPVDFRCLVMTRC